MNPPPNAVSYADIFQDSEAWRRLHTPLPKDVDPHENISRVKHDVTTIFQSMLAATQALQRAHGYSKTEIDELRKDHDGLVKTLFDDKDGAFTRTKAYIDGKFGKFTSIVLVAASSFVTASILLAVDIART